MTFVPLSGVPHSRPLATLYSFFLYPYQGLVCINIAILILCRLLSDQVTLEIFGGLVSFEFIMGALRQKDREKMHREMDSPSQRDGQYFMTTVCH